MRFYLEFASDAVTGKLARVTPFHSSGPLTKKAIRIGNTRILFHEINAEQYKARIAYSGLGRYFQPVRSTFHAWDMFTGLEIRKAVPNRSQRKHLEAMKDQFQELEWV